MLVAWGCAEGQHRFTIQRIEFSILLCICLYIEIYIYIYMHILIKDPIPFKVNGFRTKGPALSP